MTSKTKLLIQSETKNKFMGQIETITNFEVRVESTCNSTELQELLSKRKMRDNESLNEYFLNMKLLCSRGNVEVAALIQCVINGINYSVLKNTFFTVVLNLSKNLKSMKN